MPNDRSLSHPLEGALPAGIAPSLGLRYNTCPRCFTGVDDDHDGDCHVCAKATTTEAQQLRIEAIFLKISAARLGQAEALLRFAVLYPLKEAPRA